jgi:hypothetical protein
MGLLRFVACFVVHAEALLDAVHTEAMKAGLDSPCVDDGVPAD